MKEIDILVRENILALKPYQSARSLINEQDMTLLDANEYPSGQYNRYPDPFQSALKEKIAFIKEVNVEQVFIGNGSDEIIDLLIRVFCEPGNDKLVAYTPSFGMYRVSAQINNVECIELELDQSFDLNPELIDKTIDIEPKITFLCTPNNPTGNCLDDKMVKKLLSLSKGIVVIDEAYIDFSDSQSYVKLLEGYPRLVVLQTLSKAYGMAGLRLGMAYANRHIIDLLNKVKAPYNISTANQKAALDLLDEKGQIDIDIQIIIKERKRLELFFERECQGIEVYPSAANFLLIKCKNAERMYSKLLKKGIVVRNQNNKIENCLRVSVGTIPENTLFINAFKECYHAENIIY